MRSLSKIRSHWALSPEQFHFSPLHLVNESDKILKANTTPLPAFERELYRRSCYSSQRVWSPLREPGSYSATAHLPVGFLPLPLLWAYLSPQSNRLYVYGPLVSANSVFPKSQANESHREVNVLVADKQNVDYISLEQ